jgi:hypothetical protein
MRKLDVMQRRSIVFKLIYGFFSMAKEFLLNRSEKDDDKKIRLKD